MSEKRRTFTETFKSLLSPNIEKEREEEVKRKENQIRREILERRKKESEQRSSREVSSNQSQPTGRVKTRESNEIDNSALSDSKITANESNTVKGVKPIVKNDAFSISNHVQNRRDKRLRNRLVSGDVISYFWSATLRRFQN